MCHSWKKYLLWFAQEHIEFRYSEIQSILSLYKINMKFVQKPEENAPYWIVQFPSEVDAKRLANRSVSLKSCIELWAHSNNLHELDDQLRNYNRNEMERHFTPETSFKIEVETFCKHFTQKEKVEKLDRFSYLPVKGPVDLKNPALLLRYIEYYGIEANDPPALPYDIFFGRWIANGMRQIIKKLSLKTRKFIGNTTMDPLLSLLMANQAQVCDTDLVLDPFVGSGSLLVAAAQFGGYVFGTDIDYMMLHAKTRPSRKYQRARESDESIKANMTQYGLGDKYVDVLIKDFSISFWKDSLKFDSIITDPPYGIREATEKIGTSKENFTLDEKHLPTHIPSKVEYGISALYMDLLDFAAKHLRLGGRLVCFFPIYREDYEESGLPMHPCLELVSNSEQILTRLTSRRLLTYVKIQEFDQTASFTTENSITDFRGRYYEPRDETRKERRSREAKLREEYLKRVEERKKTLPVSNKD